MNGSSKRDKPPRILGRVRRAEFVGRADELARIVSHPDRSAEGRGLLILLAPAAGVSELLRQAYDELFDIRGATVPIYFSVPRGEGTPVSVAIEFLKTFLTQYIAFRRNEPSLCQASLVLSDILNLAPPADYEWIANLLTTYSDRRFGDDDQALIRFCFSAPQRVPERNARPFVMIEAMQLAGPANVRLPLDVEIIRTLSRSSLPYVVAGLRRQVLSAAHEADCDFESLDLLRLDKLDEQDARRLVEFAARRQQVELNEETRDLLVQQFDSSPFFITTFLQAAREKEISLTSYLACQQLYVDELMGGRLHHYFSNILENAAPAPETRRSLIRSLSDVTVSDNNRASFEAWGKVLQLNTSELESLLRALHIQEVVNWSGAFVEVGGPTAWKDFLKIQYRLDIQNQPRALVVADTIANALKRAPHTMASHYRRASRMKLRDLLAGFNAQLVPAVLFDHEKFKEKYRGLSADEIVAGIDSEADMVRLPQVFHTATGSSFRRQLLQLIDADSCVVAHSFEGGAYIDANEVVWLAVQLESKLEVDRELADLWCRRLESLASSCGFARIRILLFSTEGFSEEASAVLNEHDAYGLNRQQFELLAARLGDLSPLRTSSEPNEYVAILPMGEDNELLAANMVEQIARRANFGPEAINQIKTAIVEACINAAEHSLSPDRKIYQRFRVDDDKLVITISSRGVVPPKLSPGTGTKPSEDQELSDERRGWGLKLIRSLMDEVEFEQVDDGTSLRMTKYLRPASS
jgi:serine/threonine-protein kinase RsbW